MQVTSKNACPRWEFIWQRATRARCGLYTQRATLCSTLAYSSIVTRTLAVCFLSNAPPNYRHRDRRSQKEDTRNSSLTSSVREKCKSVWEDLASGQISLFCRLLGQPLPSVSRIAFGCLTTTYGTAQVIVVWLMLVCFAYFAKGGENPTISDPVIVRLAIPELLRLCQK